RMQRDFTYVDDIVEGVIRIVAAPPEDAIPYNIFNIGNSQPIDLSRFISAIESSCGRTADKIMLPMQPGDVERTYADTSLLESQISYKPMMNIEEGVSRFVEWYR